MKTLIVRLNTLCKEEKRKEIVKEIAEGIKIGVLVLDPHLDYEVVEYDSYLTDIPSINNIVTKKEQNPKIVLYKENKND